MRLDQNRDNLIEKSRIDIYNSAEMYEKSLNTQYRKDVGAYYTGKNLARQLLANTVEQVDVNYIDQLLFFEPCVGGGAFVWEYLHWIATLKLSTIKVEKILDNIYVADIDEDALTLYEKNFISQVKLLFDITISAEKLRTRIAKKLSYDLSDKTNPIAYTSLAKAFPQLGNKKFDIVITNPPYKNLRAEKKHYVDIQSYENTKIQYAKLSKIIKKYQPSAGHGTINLYQVFVEDIINKYTTSDAVITLLIPQQILSDKTTASSRLLLLSNNIKTIELIPEVSPEVDASQSMTGITLTKRKEKEYINIRNFSPTIPLKEFSQIEYVDLDKKRGSPIRFMSTRQIKILSILKKFPTVKDFSFIHNRRGELDITLNKNFLDDNGGLTLYQGRHIQPYFLKKTETNQHVNSTFLTVTRKEKDVRQARIACQQISNISQDKRLYFANIPADIILANSTNYIVVEQNAKIDLYALLGLFNSSIINEYFKIFSSNNHISNHEINYLPVPISDTETLNKMSVTVQKYLETGEQKLFDEIEKLSNELYGWKN